MMFTEEVGLLVVLARHPSGIRRSSLVSNARLVTRQKMGQETDISVTNATIDSLLVQGMVARGKEGRFFLTLDGARQLAHLHGYIRGLQETLQTLKNPYTELVA